MKMSKFQLAILILIVAIICVISIVYIRILRIKATLDKLYWIAENTHSGMVGLAIEIFEAKLNQNLAIISIALVALAIAVILLLLNKREVFKEKYAVVATQVESQQ